MYFQHFYDFGSRVIAKIHRADWCDFGPLIVKHVKRADSITLYFYYSIRVYICILADFENSHLLIDRFNFRLLFYANPLVISPVAKRTRLSIRNYDYTETRLRYLIVLFSPDVRCIRPAKKCVKIFSQNNFFFFFYEDLFRQWTGYLNVIEWDNSMKVDKRQAHAFWCPYTRSRGSFHIK